MINIAAFDIGTCTSVAAMITDAENNSDPEVFRIGSGDTGLYPSAVAFFEDKKTVKVGTEAIEHMFDHEALVVQHAKRFIGTEKGYVNDRLDLNVSPVKAQATIAKEIFGKIQRKTNWPKETIKLAFTYPIAFSQNQLQTYVDGLKRAGLDVDEKLMFSEPLAAMMCVAQRNGNNIDGKTVMVIDIGGGTTDIVIATCVNENGNPVLKTRAVGGISECGGVDYDKVVKGKISEVAVNAIGTTTGSAISVEQLNMDPENSKILDGAAEEIKQRLCDSKDKFSKAYFLRDSVPFTPAVEYDWFLNASSNLTSLINDKCDEVLQKAFNDEQCNLEVLRINKITSDDDIDLVVFIGGGSKVPAIVNELKERHPNLSEKIVDFMIVDPQYAVAMGAASLARSVLIGTGPGPTSRCTTTLGMRANDQRTMEPVCCIHLYEGDVLPTTFKRTYTFANDGQSTLATTVYSIADWKHNKGDECKLLTPGIIELGDISVNLNISDTKKGEPIIVKFEVLQNGLLNVYITFRNKTEQYPFMYPSHHIST